jgi:hypothetical protein
MFNLSFYDSFLSIKLQTYGIRNENMGYYFLAISLPYFIAALITPIVFKKVPRKLQFVLCMGVTSISMIFMGPSQMFHMPDNLFLVLSGLCSLGFIQALVLVNTLPEAIECF